MHREIAITNRHPKLRVDGRAIGRAIGVLDAHAGKFNGGCPPGELSIVFLTDKELAGIHGAFMDDPSATDVITFEGDATAGLAGEICVSADTAMRYVRTVPLSAGRKRRGTRPLGVQALHAAFSAELTLYVVHGWLHLAGYDDTQPTKKRRMRSAEKRAMTMLREVKALPAFRLP